ncbi:unnamed protein product [Mycena citricolor]|uniref:Secreted protein n=1 Tax=Mycena citricolor TaxID=2018698 RepID=A0AAD2HA97_9AGAR|nr:unnamed protein product [Mycena citricolor]
MRATLLMLLRRWLSANRTAWECCSLIQTQNYAGFSRRDCSTGLCGDGMALPAELSSMQSMITDSQEKGSVSKSRKGLRVMA